MTNTRRILTALLLLPLFAKAEVHPDYAASKIKPDLLIHANAVLRESATEIELISLNDVIVRERYVLTVMNEKGAEHAQIHEVYSKMKTINSISAYIYDADGKMVAAVRPGMFKDLPLFNNSYAEYSNNKQKYYDPSYRKYPFTIEYIVEYEQNHSFYLPSWSPQNDVHTAVENATLTVILPSIINLRNHMFHTAISPVITNGEKKQYKWTLIDIKAHKSEPFLTREEYDVPTILLTLDDFMLADHKGNMSTWANYGKFIYELNKGRDSVPEDMHKRCAQLLAGITDDHQKIKTLYDYMQNNMRYVAVEYGVGGWQTLTTAYVEHNKYGDCKALTNYMMSMLEEAGITSYPVLIKAGRAENFSAMKDFVSTQFNHVILCVPLARDTVWLECTSNSLPAGYLSDFTQGRTGLMYTPLGGYLVNTPEYGTTINFLKRHAIMSCETNGTIKITLDDLYNGESANQMYNELYNGNDHDKTEFIHTKFHLPSYDVSSYTYKKIDTSRVMTISESAVLIASGRMTVTGSRRFINMDAAPLKPSLPEEVDERKEPFYLPNSESINDVFELPIPDNTEVEFIPAAVNLSYPFGEYSCTIAKKDNMLIMTRSCSFKSGNYDATLFNNFVKLLEEMNNESHKKVVLKNKS